jgi:4-amino-4-deoxy-L-arabinose transferase-like glycosyltransferase
MPLSGWLGTLALPDAPLVLACLLALDASAALLRRVEAAALAELAVALVAGAFVHYRFAPAVFAGLVGLLLVPRGRALLARPAPWLAIGLGAAAWLPLLWWNRAHAGSGLQFQLVERHPWHFHGGGWSWLLEQAAALTPGLFVLALATGAWLWREWRRDRSGTAGLFLGVAAISVAGYFVLAFFADRERVSFHWPLAGWLALLCAAPPVLARWRPAARGATWTLAAAGLVAMLGVLAAYAQPSQRARLAESRWYPDNFAGWSEIGAAVRAQRASLPPGTRVVADNFMLGAQLGFATQDADLGVLDHPLNHKHGRAVQLQAWDLQRDDLGATAAAPVLLVVEDSARAMKDRLVAYHDLCRRLGPLPAPRVLNVDHGRKRFLLYVVAAPRARGPCTAPALAWIDAPARGARLDGEVTVSGWAFKDGSGLVAVDVLVDGAVLARADYGRPMPNVTAYWAISTDPNQPRVGFDAAFDASRLAPGEHRLGLRLHGADGSREDWPSQRFEVVR